MDTSEFLRLLEIDPDSRRYVLCPFDPGITVLKQQTRALNLIYALSENKVLAADARIAVIGGGIAGVTAAAAAARMGYEVWLLEVRSTLLHLQNGCDTRWLHPHIYDWPDVGSTRPYAGLPILDWHAASAGNVERQIHRQFADIRRSTTKNGKELISVHLNVKYTDIEQTKIEFLTDYNYNEKFDAIVFAVGFGVEQQNTSYWRNDSLNQLQAAADAQEKYEVVVSGSGDGALIDLLRLKIADFDHSHIYSDLVEMGGDRIVEDLRSIKKAWVELKIGREPQSCWLFDQFAELRKKGHLESLERELKKRLRSDTKVTLRGRYKSFSNALSLNKASMFNCFMAYMLNYLAGFTWEYAPPEKDHEQAKDRRHVVIRHGVKREDTYRNARCPEAVTLLESPDKLRKFLDSSRRIWKAGWCSGSARTEPVSAPTVAVATTFVSTLKNMFDVSQEVGRPKQRRNQLKFRITLHRLIEINGRPYYQQIARYAGTDDRVGGAVGRIFSLSDGQGGLGGLCCRFGQVVSIARTDEQEQGFDDLRSALETEKLGARPVDVDVRSQICVPLFSSAIAEDGKRPISLLLYADTNRPKFFNKSVLMTMRAACRGFLRHIEEMISHKELSAMTAGYQGFVGHTSQNDIEITKKYKTLIDKADLAGWDSLKFESVNFFDVKHQH